MRFPMRNFARLASLSTLTALIAFPSALVAQRRDWPPQHRRERPAFSIEAAGLFSSLQGDALGSTGDGAGFDAMGSIGSGMFSIGGGYQRQSLHRSTDGNATVSGAFIEPRIALPFAAGNFTPYVFARGARLTRRASSTFAVAPANGTAIGGGVGSLFWVAPNVQINTALLWQDLRFDQTSTAGLPIVSNERARGSQWSVRAGLSIGFDSWGR